MKSVNLKVNFFYWLERLNQQRLCWLIWGLFVLIKRSFAKAVVIGDCCHRQLGAGAVYNWAVFNTHPLATWLYWDLSRELNPFVTRQVLSYAFLGTV